MPKITKPYNSTLMVPQLLLVGALLFVLARGAYEEEGTLVGGASVDVET